MSESLQPREVEYGDLAGEIISGYDLFQHKSSEKKTINQAEHMLIKGAVDLAKMYVEGDSLDGVGLDEILEKYNQASTFRTWESDHKDLILSSKNFLGKMLEEKGLSKKEVRAINDMIHAATMGGRTVTVKEIRQALPN